MPPLYENENPGLPGTGALPGSPSHVCPGLPASSELQGTRAVSAGWPLSLEWGSPSVPHPLLGLQSYLLFVSGT